MLELFLLYMICKKMGESLRAKKRKPFLFQLMLVALWFGGEFTGAVVVTVIHMMTSRDPAPMGMVYGVAILGGVLGAIAAFTIAHLTPARKPLPAFPVVPAEEMRKPVQGSV
jgi:hypothetical protein